MNAKPKVTMTIKKIEYSLEFQCSRCRKMRPAYMFVGIDQIYKTCELCRKVRGKV